MDGLEQVRASAATSPARSDGEAFDVHDSCGAWGLDADSVSRAVQLETAAWSSMDASWELYCTAKGLLMISVLDGAAVANLELAPLSADLRPRAIALAIVEHSESAEDAPPSAASPGRSSGSSGGPRSSAAQDAHGPLENSSGIKEAADTSESGAPEGGGLPGVIPTTWLPKTYFLLGSLVERYQSTDTLVGGRVQLESAHLRLDLDLLASTRDSREGWRLFRGALGYDFFRSKKAGFDPDAGFTGALAYISEGSQGHPGVSGAGFVGCTLSAHRFRLRLNASLGYLLPIATQDSSRGGTRLALQLLIGATPH